MTQPNIRDRVMGVKARYAEGYAAGTLVYLNFAKDELKEAWEYCMNMYHATGDGDEWRELATAFANRMKEGTTK